MRLFLFFVLVIVLVPSALMAERRWYMTDIIMDNDGGMPTWNGPMREGSSGDDHVHHPSTGGGDFVAAPVTPGTAFSVRSYVSASATYVFAPVFFNWDLDEPVVIMNGDRYYGRAVGSVFHIVGVNGGEAFNLRIIGSGSMGPGGVPIPGSVDRNEVDGTASTYVSMSFHCVDGWTTTQPTSQPWEEDPEVPAPTTLPVFQNDGMLAPAVVLPARYTVSAGETPTPSPPSATVSLPLALPLGGMTARSMEFNLAAINPDFGPLPMLRTVLLLFASIGSGYWVLEEFKRT